MSDMATTTAPPPTFDQATEWVHAEMRGQAEDEQVEWLKEHRKEWIEILDSLIGDVNHQLALARDQDNFDPNDEGFREWKRRAVSFRHFCEKKKREVEFEARVNASLDERGVALKQLLGAVDFHKEEIVEQEASDADMQLWDEAEAIAAKGLV